MTQEPDSNTPSHAPSIPSSGEGASPRCVDSAELLQNQREITIRHGNETYRLRLTRSGKLILHK